MSGGSYNYLCWIDHHNPLLERLATAQGDLDDMSSRLAGLGYAADAAAETEELLLLIRQFENRARARIERLTDVWKAIEWWDSCDWGEERVQEALAKYRGEAEGALERDVASDANSLARGLDAAAVLLAELQTGVYHRVGVLAVQNALAHLIRDERAAAIQALGLVLDDQIQPTLDAVAALGGLLILQGGTRGLTLRDPFQNPPARDT